MVLSYTLHTSTLRPRNNVNNKNLINEDEIIDGFNKVIKKSDKVIVLYSGLWSFIFNINFKKKKIPNYLLEIIEKIVSKKRTLVLPAYSGDSFLKNNEFHIDKSIDRNGLLPLTALKSKRYYRTPQPLHSYLVFGKLAKDIKRRSFETSWGKNSIFEWFSKHNARICVFGVPWHKGCSYLHRYEELKQVPWRYYKTYKGDLYKNNKKIGKCFEKKYSKLIGLKYDLSPIVNCINKKKILKSNSKKFFLESTTCDEIDKANIRFFKIDPWRIIKNKSIIKNK